MIRNTFKTPSMTAACALAIFLSACSAAGPSADDSRANKPVQTVDRAAADIGDLRKDGAQVQSLQTPDGFKRGDKIVAYEGPGWESDKVAYRLYLDGRNALDIFGKKTNAMVLSTVGRGDDYHAMADWGMDILKVGNSLGAGGFGIFKDGEAVQIGEAARYSAEISKDTDDEAAIIVTHAASQACGGDIRAQYSIKGGARMTRVSVRGDCEQPYAAGIIIHPGTSKITSNASAGEWQYVARFGAQSLVPDNLGMALFYRQSDVAAVGDDDDDSYIVFKGGVSPNYYTAAAWAQEIGGIQTNPEFITWLDATQTKLNGQ